MPVNRTFSFEDDDDEGSLSSNRQVYQQHHNADAHSPYRDSPSRDIISPPPRYASPPRDHDRSPSPSPHGFIADSRSTQSRSIRAPSHEISRERSRDNYTDESPPPPPPPHRTRGSVHTTRSSTSREVVSSYPAAYIGHDGTSDREVDRVTRDMPEPYGREDGYEGTRSTQPSSQSGQFLSAHAHDINHYAEGSTPRFQQRSSYASNIPLAAGAATPGSMTPTEAPDFRSSHHSGRSIPLEDYTTSHNYQMAPYPSYHESPYHSTAHHFDPTVSDASIDPYNIADDGDDGFMPEPKRKSALPIHRSRSRGPNGATAGVAAPVGAAAGGGLLGGILSRKTPNQTVSGSYGPVAATQSGSPPVEKSEWLSRQNKGANKMRWVVGLVIGLVVVIAIAAGIIGGVLGTRSAKSSTPSDGSINNAGTDTAQNGDLDLNSAEIKKLMNNPNLHKVFPGMDYTPWGVQYPLCLTYPPSQNNVTRDMAVLSQLTNTVRLYGTDCNQTEMVLHAIDRLQLKSMKVWLGVWIDTNQTTTDRQLAQMYKILGDVKDRSIFKGAIIGNEALYRAGEDKAQSKQELIQILTDVKSNFTTLGYDMPIGTSDLGDNWDGDLVQASDFVMSNVHPFFAGVTAEEAAAWTYNFWSTHDLVLTQNLPNVQQVISETGWPSGGGTDCGGTDGSCASGQSGAVASVANMNTFMNDWVCQALQNGTEYFWFEAFDEPWKVRYNTASQAWEDKWGLMDAARVLKAGVKIPSCGGQTVAS